MNDKHPNKHALRTQETKQRLLAAAEKVFERDGYERAELGEIAAHAGRTKGAIYAHFKSKEDIFLALVQAKSTEYTRQIDQSYPRNGSPEENIATMRRFFLDTLGDQSLAMLLLEFKLYALRHPESKARWSAFFESMLPDTLESDMETRYGRDTAGDPPIRRTVAMQLLHPMLSALATEAIFMPQSFDQETIRQIAGRVFDAILGSGMPSANKKAQTAAKDQKQ